MMPLCLEDGVGVIPWSPLARGFLAGTRKDGEAQTTRAKSDKFGESMYHTPPTTRCRPGWPRWPGGWGVARAGGDGVAAVASRA